MARACFTFDNLGEAAEITDGHLDGPRPGGTDPSVEAGLPALLALCARHGVTGTFFVEGWNGLHHPDAVRSVVDAGHELGMHGWMHESWGDLDPVTERRLAGRATEALTAAAGRPPVGFRAPGGARTPATAGLLAELGYAFDASLGDGMSPALLDGGLPSVPFVWPGVDGYWYLRQPPEPPGVVGDEWLATLDRVAAAGGLFVLVCHAFITGIDERRVEALERVMRSAAADPRVEITTVGAVARGLTSDP